MIYLVIITLIMFFLVYILLWVQDSKLKQLQDKIIDKQATTIHYDSYLESAISEIQDRQRRIIKETQEANQTTHTILANKLYSDEIEQGKELIEKEIPGVVSTDISVVGLTEDKGIVYTDDETLFYIKPGGNAIIQKE